MNPDFSSLPSIQDFISPYQRNRFDRYRDAPPESTWAWRQSAWKYTSSIAKSQYAFAIRFHESFVILAIHLILSDLLLRNGCRDERKLRASIAYRIIGGNKSSSLDSRVWEEARMGHGWLQKSEKYSAIPSDMTESGSCASFILPDYQCSVIVVIGTSPYCA